MSIDTIKSTALLDGSIATADIADDAVTADKLANSINTSIAAKAPLASPTFTGNFTSTGIDDNATSTAITIDSAEDVGIGTTSPTFFLTVIGDATGDQATINMTHASYASSALKVGAVRSPSSAYNLLYLAAGTAAGGTGGAEQFSIRGDGEVTVKTGNLVIDTSGKGIAIGGTGAANTLDDYEEGTWSPTLSSSTGTESNRAYSSTSGTYVKVGKSVTCTFLIGCTVNGTGGTGEAVIRGIPFTPDQYGSGAFGRATGFPHNRNAVSLDVEPNNVRVYLMVSTADSVSPLTYIAPSGWGTCTVTGTITYTTA